jgi:hypothetical protein
MLKQNCINTYEGWINIGLILYNCKIIDKNEINYLEIWDDWSMKSKKYEKDMCDHCWKLFKNKEKIDASFVTLFDYAKMDNPDEYNKLRIKYMTNL